MITLTINGTAYSIPSSWKDVTYKHYCEVLKHTSKPTTIHDRLNAFTGIAVDLLSQFTMAQLVSVCEIVSFMDVPESALSFALPYEGVINISTESYGKLEASKQAIKKAAHPFLAGAAIVKQYTGEDITEKPILDCISQVAFFLSSLQSSTSDLKG